MNLNCKILDFGSEEQLNSIELRRKILRKPLGLEFTEDELQTEADQIHIACMSGLNLVGILLLVKKNDHTLKMRQVAVDDHLQGQGIGKAMVRFAEDWAIDNGFYLMELHARISAVPFYLSLAYKTAGSEFMEVSIPHLKMIKEL